MAVQYATTMEDWLDAYDFEPPKRGQTRRGVILKKGVTGITVDIGLKRDGFVPSSDLERLEEDTVSDLEPGQEIVTRILKPQREPDGNHILSLFQVQVDKDWEKAEELMEQEEVWHGTVTGYNRGGLLVKFGALQGFVPASHVSSLGRRRDSNALKSKLQEYVDQELPFKVIEVTRHRRRLILSERLATKQEREAKAEQIFDELIEGEIHEGAVCHICNFGAFVDLGGMDGLIHISELAWHTVRHPGDVVQVGDQVKVYVLKLDHERKRISLSLKRLQPNPWVSAYKNFAAGQLVVGKVTNVVDFGAFVALDVGLEGLVHVSELSDPPPENSRDVVKPGDEVVVRIISIDVFRQRLALSLKRVSAEERAAWLSDQSPVEVEAVEERVADEPEPAEETATGSESVEQVEQEATDETAAEPVASTA